MTKGGQVPADQAQMLNELKNRTTAQEYGKWLWQQLASTGLVGQPFERTPVGQASLMRGMPLEQQLQVSETDPAFGFVGSTIGKAPYSTMAEKMAVQGGALSSKPGLRRITQVLEDHGMEWVESPNGGITAYSEVVDQFGRVSKEGKHFAENTSLRTVRDWLGY